MAEVLKEFTVRYGFDVDSAGMSKAEAETKAAEERIVQANAAALAKRVADERKAQNERIAGVIASGEKLSDEDRKYVEDQEKRRVSAAEAAHKREAEGAKKTSALRSEQFKEATQNFLRMSSVAQQVSTGIGGFLTAIPFGSFVSGIVKTAGSMSDLAVQSQRVGSSAAGIQKFLFAMRMQGVGEGEATSALEGFAAKMKTNPEGFRQALERLGVKTKDASGKALGYDEQLENFGGYLASQPFNIAQVQANAFGISGPNALNALRDQGGLRKGLSAYDAKLSAFGLDPDKVSEDARKVDQAYANLEANLKLVNTRLQADFFVPVMNSFDGLATWMEAHPDATKNLGRGLVALSLAATVRVIPAMVRLIASLSGFNAIVGTLAPAALKILGIGSTAAGAAAATILAGGAAAGAEKAPMVDEYGRVTGNWGGDSAHPFHQGEEGGPSAGGGRSTTTFGTMWGWLKNKMGLGEDDKVKRDIATTAEGVKKLAENAIGVGTGISAGGGTGMGGAMGAARRALGWAATAGGDHTHVSGAGPVAGLKNNPNATKENADSIRAAAKDLGTTPEDLATVIAYESAGTFSPKKWGGKGGNYMGLIQFGPNERRTYGANENQTFAQQMEAVKRYLKDRGFKPGMGLLDLYSTINAGSPGHYGASDGNGTVSSHVTRMQGAHAALARAFLGVGGSSSGSASETTPAAPAAPSSSDVMSEAERDKAEAFIYSLGKAHPLTQAEKDKAESMQKRLDAYYASKPKGTMDHKGAWAKATYKDGTPVGVSPEISRAAKKRMDEGSDDFPTTVAPDGTSKPVKVEITDSSAANVGTHFGKALPGWMKPGANGPLHTTDMRDPKYAPGKLDPARQKLADAMHEEAKRHLENLKLIQRANHGTLNPLLHGSAVTPAEMLRRRIHQQIHRHGDFISQGDTFNVHAKDAKTGLAAADDLSARRQSRDRARFGGTAVV